MSWYDSLIPSSVKISGGSAGTSHQKVNFATAEQGNLLEEAAKKISGTFTDVKAKFKKLTAGGQDLKKVVPAAPQPTAATAGAIKQETAASGGGAPDNTDHKVKLEADVADGEEKTIINDPAFPHEPLSQRVVEFDAMPEVSEVRNAEYEALHTPQMPGEFQKYKGTKSTQWTITGTFTARNTKEAYRNYVYLNNLRGWTMPYFGQKQSIQFGGNGGEQRGKLGAPPPVLKFSGWRGIVGKVPVVITALNWNWPKECDWIPTGIKDKNNQDVPFPTVMNVTVTLVESFSPDQFNKFNLVAFRNGRMVDAWSGEIGSYGDMSPAEPEGGNQGIQGGVPDPVSTDTATTAIPNTWSTGDFARYDRMNTSAPATVVSTASTAGDGNVEDLGLG